MTMSTIAMLTAITGSIAPPHPRLVTAEEGVEIHRRAILAVSATPCGQTRPEGDILVCGRAPSPYGIGPAADPAPGRRIRGEPADYVQATRETTCTNIGASRGCPSIDLVAAAMTIAKALGKALRGD